MYRPSFSDTTKARKMQCGQRMKKNLNFIQRAPKSEKDKYNRFLVILKLSQNLKNSIVELIRGGPNKEILFSKIAILCSNPYLLAVQGQL